MAFQASVIIRYLFPGMDQERSYGFTIEQDAPITRADIAAEVEAVALDLVNPAYYPQLERFAGPASYTWEVESVFEFT